MAVVLRLSRHGGHKNPFYHIVAADSRKPRDGQFIEKLGTYDPASQPSKIAVDAARAQHWYARGAVPSTTVAKLLKISKVKLERDRPKSGPTAKSKTKKSK